MPVAIPQGLSRERSIEYVNENFTKRGIDTKLVNPVWIDWRDETYKKLQDVYQQIGQRINHRSCNVNERHLGELIFKAVPSDDEVRSLHFPDLKMIYANVWRTWNHRCKKSYGLLKDKVKEIKDQKQDSMFAGVEYGEMP